MGRETLIYCWEQLHSHIAKGQEYGEGLGWRVMSTLQSTASCEVTEVGFYFSITKIGLEETQSGIKIAGRNINNLRYADDTTLMAESEEELKSLLMKVRVKKLA